ncbi:hypothetical protein [Celeribacter arenosi]|uniref:Uncharacterized protein n=1 Tax=Celeribacter arenosi TaxID=792649 RepID=A0ABP7K2C4_9RHOB
MIRPEMRASIWRWREVIGAVGMLALCLWMALSFFGVMAWIGWILVVVLSVYIFAAVQRVRFSAGSGGYGVVEIDEGVISYLLPHGGGQIEIASMSSVVLLPASRGPAHWQLDAADQSPLLIPLDAIGAEQLFDVFVNLDGIETEKMLRQIKAAPDQPVIIWRNRKLALH